MSEQHWTAESLEDFLYSIASDFMLQADRRRKEFDPVISRTRLAEKTKLDKTRISQLFNNPGNLTLKTMLKIAQALDMKVSVVAYDDADPYNTHGPINATVFAECWEVCGKPVRRSQINPPLCVVGNPQVETKWQEEDVVPRCLEMVSFDTLITLDSSGIDIGSDTDAEKEYA